MLIMAQDRKSIVNIDESFGLSITTSGSVIAHSASDTQQIRVGGYSSEEKAMKVLDMISTEYQYMREYEVSGNGAVQPSFVFQMPQESEV